MTSEELEQFLTDALAGVPLDPYTAAQVLESWKEGQRAIKGLKEISAFDSLGKHHQLVHIARQHLK